MMHEFLKTEIEIKNWLNAMSVENYSIKKHIIPNNSLFVVDIAQNVSLRQKQLSYLPIQFGLIRGSFDISDNSLTSLKGTPFEIVGPFYCHDNPLSSLDYAPKKAGVFSCSGELALKKMPSLECEINFDFIHCEKQVENIIPELKELYQYDATYKGWVLSYKINSQVHKNVKTIIQSLIEKSRLEKNVNQITDTLKIKKI